MAAEEPEEAGAAKWRAVRRGRGAHYELGLARGRHRFGRGLLLDCEDKRVSRQHGQLEVTNTFVILTALHQNPCFVIKKDSTETQVLKLDSSIQLMNGDRFGLLPNDFWYEIIKYVPNTMDSERNAANSIVKVPNNVVTVPEHIATAAGNIVTASDNVATAPHVLTTTINVAASLNNVTTASDNVVLMHNEDNLGNSDEEVIDFPYEDSPDEERAESPSLLEKQNTANLKTTIVEDDVELNFAAFEEDMEETNTRASRTGSPALINANKDTPTTTSGANKRSHATTTDTNTSLAKMQRSMENIARIGQSSSSDSSRAVDEIEVKPSTSVLDATVASSVDLTDDEVDVKPSSSILDAAAHSVDLTDDKQDVKPSTSALDAEMGIKREVKDESASGPQKVPVAPSDPGRERCMYGAQCYRRNPQHKLEFSHPQDADWGSGSQAPCPWGVGCTRRDPRHWRDHTHPPGTLPPGPHGPRRGPPSVVQRHGNTFYISAHSVHFYDDRVEVEDSDGESVDYDYEF